ncbi:hypothetical protein V5799_000387 [Amblyomma americanum]|uniref:M13 family peptidase n=1 Tax=Amblyomma americanum TaxID=6943 RepID=A0AAQ4D371_AMBAM
MRVRWTTTPVEGVFIFLHLLFSLRAPKTLPKRRSMEEVEALKGLQEMVRIGSPFSPSPRGSTGRKHDTFRKTAAIVFLLFVITIVGAVVFYLANTLPGRRVVPAVCTTRACLDHAQALGLKRDKSLEACEDFGQFVCSGWLHDDTRPSVSAPLFRLAYWLLGRAQLHEDPRQPLTKRVRLMMNAYLCVGGSTADINDSKSLVEFVSKELCPWLLDPTDARLGHTDGYSVSLRALVNLSVLWTMPLWFYVDITEPWHGTGYSRSVSMNPLGISYITEIINHEVNKYEGFYNSVID